MRIDDELTVSQMSTIGGILATIVGLIIWDVFLAVDAEKGNTISEIAVVFGQCPAIPLFFGIISGHCFWPKRGMRTGPMEAGHIITMVGSVIGLYLWFNFSNDVVIRFLSANPVAVLAGIGLPMGHFLWPQYTKEMT